MGAALLGTLLWCSQTTAQTTPEDRIVEVAPGERDLRELQRQNELTTAPESQWWRLRVGEVHHYRVFVETNYYIRVAMYLHGIDAAVTAFDPDGVQIMNAAAPSMVEGKRSVWWIAQRAGVYRIEVRAANKEAPAGAYDLAIQREWGASAENSDLTVADQLTAEGWRLHETGTESALRQAIPILKDAVSHWRAAVQYFSAGKPNPFRGPTRTVNTNVNILDAQGNAMMYLGEIYYRLGEYQSALETYKEVLQIWRGGVGIEGWAYSNIALTYAALGNLQQAMDSATLSNAAYLRYLAGRTESAGGNEVGVGLTTLGALYLQFGDHQKAKEYLELALRNWRASANIRGEARALLLLGEVYADLGASQLALDNFRRAGEICGQSSDSFGEGRALNSLAVLYTTLGDYQKALETHTENLRIRRSAGDSAGQGETLTGLGMIARLAGKQQQALTYLNEALPLRHASGDPRGEADTLYQLARVERDLNQLPGARDHTEVALKLIEGVRITLNDPELRASYLARVHEYYDFYVDLLMQLHRASPDAGFELAAFKGTERARARGLVESLGQAEADISEGIRPELLEQERSLKQRLAARTEYMWRLRTQSFTHEQATEILQEVRSLTLEYEEAHAQIRAQSPRYAALLQPQPLGAKEIQAQLDENTLLLEYSLGDEASYLWAVSRHSINSFELPKRAVIDKSARRVYDLLTARNQHPQAESDAQFRVRVAKADGDFQAAAQNLSRMILVPVASQLGTKRLIIVTEGPLQFIPFAALPTPSQEGQSSDAQGSSAVRNPQFAIRNPQSLVSRPLILDHEIVALPSASILAPLREEEATRKPAANMVAVLADPVFTANDPRVRQSPRSSTNRTIADQGRSARGIRPNVSKGLVDKSLVSVAGRRLTVPPKSDLERAVDDLGDPYLTRTIPRLPSTRWEAQQIVASSPKPSLAELDFSASRQEALSGKLSQYRMIHFATHALIDDTHPELSGLVLSLVDERGEPQDGYLRAPDIYNLKLSADLVVLSACRTGLGKDVRGEGLIGLTRGFMYAGAPRVIVSLWRVNDQPTAELMARFYRHMFTPSPSTSPTALSSSPQGPQSETHDPKFLAPASALRSAQLEMLKDPRWQSPYFWAAFTLQGEWR